MIEHFVRLQTVAPEVAALLCVRSIRRPIDTEAPLVHVFINLGDLRCTANTSTALRREHFKKRVRWRHAELCVIRLVGFQNFVYPPNSRIDRLPVTDECDRLTAVRFWLTRFKSLSIWMEGNTPHKEVSSTRRKSGEDECAVRSRHHGVGRLRDERQRLVQHLEDLLIDISDIDDPIPEVYKRLNVGRNLGNQWVCPSSVPREGNDGVTSAN